MAAIDDVDELIERFYLTMPAFLNGNAEPTTRLFSRRDDVTLANPYGPPGRGWEQVARITGEAASRVRAGEMVAVETIAKCVTSELAYVLVIERVKAKVGGSAEITPFALRVTMIFRPEDGVWKIVHRHADPIITPKPAESIIRK